MNIINKKCLLINHIDKLVIRNIPRDLHVPWNIPRDLHVPSQHCASIKLVYVYVYVSFVSQHFS